MGRVYLNKDCITCLRQGVMYYLFDTTELDSSRRNMFRDYLTENNIVWSMKYPNVYMCKKELADTIDYLQYKGIRVYSLLKVPKRDARLGKEIKPLIDRLGGAWLEKLCGYLFIHNKNVSEQINAALSGGYELSERYKTKEKYQFYPTPDCIAKYVVELCDLQENDVVLEPSAGQGALLKWFPKVKKTITVELFGENVNILRGMGYNPIQEDFLKLDNLTYNKVVMNPPFKMGSDVKHVMHAYKHLQEGGMLVAIINENSLYYISDRFAEFRKFLETVNYQAIVLPLGSFCDSDTSVSTCVLVINK